MLRAQGSGSVILSDIGVIAALAVFVLAWFVRALPQRPLVLFASALAAVAIGVAGVLDDRWQDGLGAVVGLLLLLALGVNRLRKPRTPRGVPFASGALFALFAAAAAGLIWLFPITSLPKQSGDALVGVRDFELTDASRLGVLGAAPDAPRRLLVRVWYPAQSHTEGQSPEPYFSAAEAHTTARDLGALIGFPPFLTYLKHARTNSYRDAPLIEGAHDLPVIFYSHGYTIFLNQNTALMEELASHGYVVFSVQHTGDASATVFPNGDVAPMDPALVAMARTQAAAPPPREQIDAMTSASLDVRLEAHLALTEKALRENDRILQSAAVWLADRRFVHDRLQAGDAPPDIRAIAAASNFARVGEIGMSFGGSTTGGLCMYDPRCAAGVNLDGADFHLTPLDADIPVPFLMFHSDMSNLYQAFNAPVPATGARAFNEFSYDTFAHGGARPDVHRVQLRGARHMGLTDFSLFMRRPVRDGFLGVTPSPVLIGAQSDFVRGFFDHYLRGEANGFPAPQLAAYRGWIGPARNADLPAWWEGLTPTQRAVIETRIAALRVQAAAHGLD